MTTISDAPPSEAVGLSSPLLPAAGGGVVSIRFTIFGQAYSKANSRSLVTMNRWSDKKQASVKMPASIKSPEAREFERNALRQIPPLARKGLTCRCGISIRAFYASEQPDLDMSLVLDCLQHRYRRANGVRTLTQRGVVANDRQFREQHFYHAIDKKNPRCEIEIWPLVGATDELFDSV